MRRGLAGMAMLCACVLFACDAADGTGPAPGDRKGGWSSDPREATDPAGVSTPLKSLESEAEVEEALKWAGVRIDEYRAKGVTTMVDALKKKLGAAGVDTGALDKLDDAHVGAALPSAVDAQGNPVEGAKVPAYAEYFYCPILTPEPSQDNDCARLVEPVVLEVQKQISDSMAEVEQTITAQHQDLSPEARGFIVAWAQTAMKYGGDVAAIYATQELRAAGKCDTKVAAMKVARLLGVEQGQAMVLAHYPWAQAQAATCVVNTDVIAAQVKSMTLGEVKAFMNEHKVCVGVDVSNQNAVLLRAEEKREEGIKEGISNQVEVLRGLLLQWTTACQRTGDPLTLDLDGSGIDFAAAPVSFDLLGDGHPQRVSWVGPRAALLGIDLDGDGRIGSGTELFGDRSQCGGARCLDGVAALAAHDSPALGGNSDGLIDASDAVFGRLRLWTDANQDGVCQPGELRTLGEAGVLSLGLTARHGAEQRSGGGIGARLEVLTTGGFRSAYDVWLRMGLARANLAALRP